MNFSAKAIAEFLNGEIQGDEEITINNVAKIEEASKGTLAFLSNLKYENYLYITNASIVLVNKNFTVRQAVKATLIRVDDAYKSFASLLELYQQVRFNKQGIEQPSYIDTTAKIGENVYIAAFAYISKNAKIGNNVKIYPHVFVGENVTIGDNTILNSGVKIYFDCVLGKNCIIHSGTIVGSDGFGFAPQKDVGFKKIPQIGNVIIEDNVEVGANSTIDRATIGSTIIKKNVKLDNLIQIAHNVEIGENTVIAAQTGVSGSVKLGKNCMIGGQVGFIGHIYVANNVKIGAQAAVSNNIKKEDVVYIGSPAIPYRDFFRSSAVFKKLPSMNKAIFQLEKDMKTIKKTIEETP